MINLTNPDEIKNLDPKGVYGSTGLFIDQCRQIWKETKTLTFPQEYKQVQNIVLCGMGGSSYGGHIVKRLYKENLTVPLTVVSDYTLPASVNNKTLAILGSYSGNTEETLTTGQEAKKQGALISGVTTGGKLGDFLKENGSPSLVFTPTFNPSGQPRLGTGYMVLGVIALLAKMGLLSVSDGQAEKAIDETEKAMDATKKDAQEIAKTLKDTLPVIFAAQFLGGNAHIMRNQFNETSKSFSAFSELPELNHHLLEGLRNPKGHKLQILFLSSNLYSPILQKRVKLTKDVVEKNNVPQVTYDARGSSKLSQMLNVLAFGGYLTLYLALLYGLDPSLIPWVDYFKEHMQK